MIKTLSSFSFLLHTLTFILYTFSFILYPSVAYADNLGSTKVYYASGEKSQTDDIEERDLSGSFSFHKYGLSVKTEPLAGFHYRTAFSYYKKDFDAGNDHLDNEAKIFDTRLSWPFHKNDRGRFAFNADYKLRSKRYKNSPSSEYDQNSLSSRFDLAFGKNYSLQASAGIKDYDYINNSASNQLKSFFKVAPGIKGEHLSVSGYYKKDLVDQSQDKKDYTEDSVSIRTTLNLDQLSSHLWGEGGGYRIPFLYKLAGHFGYGRNDTRETEEDREDSLRFEYRLWDITSYYKLNKSIDTQLTYGQMERNYFTSINSYDNWFIKNKTKFSLFKKEPFNFDLLLGGEHKETKFYENDTLSYKKNSLSGGFDIIKRKGYSLKPNFNFTKYDYPPDTTSNQKSYQLSLDFKKYISSTDNAFELGYWYKWKDYKYKPDLEQWAVNLSFELKF